MATTNGCGQTWSTVIRILRRSSKPRSGVRGGRPWSTTGIHFLSSPEVPGARPVYNVHEHRDFASSGIVDVPRIRSLQTVQLEDIASATLLTMIIPWHLLCEAKGNRLFITATDLELSIHTSCEAKVKKEGAGTIPAKKLIPAWGYLAREPPELLLTSVRSLSVSLIISPPL